MAKLKWFLTNENVSPFDALIDTVIMKMHDVGPQDDTYPELLESLERLKELQASDRPQRISRDTMFIVLGNVLIAGGMIIYEQKHVVASKAMTLLMKPKTG